MFGKLKIEGKGTAPSILRRRSAALHLLIGILLCSSTMADSLSEDFDGIFPPTGWTQNSIDQKPTQAHSGSSSAYFSAGSDYLITPPLNNDQRLTFWTYTTSSDPDIIVETASSASGPWIPISNSPFSGDTGQWNERTLNLSSTGTLYVKFNKNGSGSLYIDDVSTEDGGPPPANSTPALAAIGNQSVTVRNALNFAVTATDIDNDPIILSVSNLPPGAEFNTVTNAGSVSNNFSWAVAAPVGVYTSTFYAHDGTTNASETITITVIEPPKLMITEVADPAGTGGGDYRFVELYNAGNNPVDLAAGGWVLSKQVNGGSWYDIPLTGIVAPSKAWVIATGATDFQDTYGFAPDQESGTISGNGDDAYFLFSGGDHTTGILVDIYGEFDTDGTDTVWDYEDSRAERNKTISRPNPVWTAAEWILTPGATPSEMTPGIHGPSPEFQGLENQFVFLGDDLTLEVTAINTVRTDVITLSANALPAGATFPTTTGTNTVSNTLSWIAPTAGVYQAVFTAEGFAGSQTKSISLTVSSTAKIIGYFRGWKNDTLVKLDNGQFWRNTGGVGSPVDQPLYTPQISVTNVFGTRRMIVEGVSGYTTVEQIQIEESSTPDPFTGLHNGNLYSLADGTRWKQISFENIHSTTDPLTVWRWAENNETFLRFLDSNDAVIGTCKVAPAAEPENPALISQIDGTFHGWKNKRIFALKNGQFWQQLSADSSIETLSEPTVTITNWLQTGIWRMIVDGARAPGYVEVRQRTDVTHTAIDGNFQGFSIRNFFHLQNGSWWQQTSLDSSTSTRFNPDVLIWDESGTTYLDMPNEGRTVTAEKLTVAAESTVTNNFSGLHYGNAYQLANGEEWLQIGFENINSDATNPNAVLWIDKTKTNLLLRSSSDEFIGNCIVTTSDGDDDGDRFPNAAELIAGTNPADKDSVFETSQPTLDENGNRVLTWIAVEGRSYTILWTSSLGKAFLPQATVDAPTNSWIDRAHTATSEGFYKIEVRRTP